MTNAEHVAIGLDIVGFFLVTTDLYGSRLEKLGENFHSSETTRSLIRPITFGGALATPAYGFLGTVALYIAILATGGTFKHLLSLFGFYLDDVWRELGWLHRLANTAVMGIVAFYAWLFAFGALTVALGVPLTLFYKASERLGFKRALIVLGALCFVASKVLTIAATSQ
ncbi:hypothetical protein NX784_24995 [Massilia pinisoli]|uniref:Tripartite tricarboxylate transporter TctB family protein n=1 Tax=Massilia pinisoli TaxID=1772194 RepID=A0ABT1ZY93_9BURK|nr:hypothetical protein [Massilia pinisoli]MCS0584849.1 hypothetical protein [Massilia pinisoli]